MTDRVHQLAQAVQVADLLADRVDLVNDLLAEPLAGRDAGWVERMNGALANLVRARDAYGSVREPVRR